MNIVILDQFTGIQSLLSRSQVLYKKVREDSSQKEKTWSRRKSMNGKSQLQD
jgi:hypothetical protein